MLINSVFQHNSLDHWLYEQNHGDFTEEASGMHPKKSTNQFFSGVPQIKTGVPQVSVLPFTTNVHHVLERLFDRRGDFFILAADGNSMLIKSDHTGDLTTELNRSCLDKKENWCSKRRLM